MPWQLIFTSAPQGMAPGQSGFCTVARSAELREALVTRLEQLSSYHHLTTSGGGANPLIAAYRIIDIRGTKYHVLTRIGDAGLDFTSRTNHLAHHLIFTPQELPALPSPALVLRHWGGWRRVWREQPRWLTEADAVPFSLVPRSVPLPAAAWAQWGGDAARAAGLLETAQAQGCYLWSGPGQEGQLLDLFAEALQLLDPEGRNPAATWQHTFTTFLQGEDNLQDFQWRACWPNTAAFAAAERASGTPLRLTQLRAPDNRVAYLARQGAAPPSAPVLPSHAKTRLRLQPRAGQGTQAGPAMAALPAHLGSAHRLFRRLFDRILGPTGRWVCLAAVLVFAAVAAVIWRQGNSSTAPPPEPPITDPVASEGSAADQASPPRPAQTQPVGPRPPRGRVDSRDPDREAGRSASAAVASMLPDVETHLLVAAGGQLIELQPAGAVARLLQALSRDQNPVSAADLEVYSQALAMAADWPRLTSPTGRLTCEVSVFAKQLHGRGVAGQTWSLDFADWFKGQTGAPARLQVGDGAASGSSAWYFQPAAYASNAFRRFRLLVLHPARPPQPLELPVELLRPDQTNWPATVREPLRGRLQQFVLPAGSGLQFRPFVPGGEGRPPVDLLTQLPEALRPPPGFELDLRWLRARVERERREREAVGTRQNARLEELQASLAQPATNGSEWPLGSLVGLPEAHALFSFPQYLRAGRILSDHTNQYVAYVRRVLDLGTSSNLWNGTILANSLNRNGAYALREVQPFLANAMLARGAAGTEPPGRDFFWRAWSELVARDRAQAELRQLQQLLGQEAARPPVPVVPAGLDQLTHVSFMLQYPGGAMELIRFPSRGRPQPSADHDRDRR